MRDSQNQGPVRKFLAVMSVLGMIAAVITWGFLILCGGIALSIMGFDDRDLFKWVLWFWAASLALAFWSAAVDASNAITNGSKESERNFFDFFGDYPALKLIAFACFIVYLLFFLGEPDDRNLSSSQFDLLVASAFAVFASFFYDASSFRTHKPKAAPGPWIMRKLWYPNAFDFQRRKRDHLLESALERIDVSDLARVRFVPTGGNSFSISTPKMVKIARLVCKKLGKTDFAPEELRDYFERFALSAQSELPPEMVEKIVMKTEEFVVAGGRVEFEKVS